ncbi:DNA mismatch repair protein MutT [Candidatus Saccharibacteria bacterium]|nr:MAG: DNA mismatch repair protein MutT [Candidatus Saccharibacteria bacterium]
MPQCAYIALITGGTTVPKETAPPTLVGCELFVRKDRAILLGKRKNCYGAGTWALPGGHLEFNERLVDAVCREAKEELGAIVKPQQLRMVSVVDDLQPQNNLHYVHISFELRDPQWEPRIMEPERCAEWRYFALDDLPSNFFEPHVGIIDNYLAQRLYLLQ